MINAATTIEQEPISKFASGLIDLLDRVEYRRVLVKDEFDPIYHLRYEAYRREEFVPISSREIVRDEFEELPNAYCYGIYIDDQLVSSIRFHYLTAEFRDSPSYSVFTDVLDPLLDQSYTMLDPGRFTVDYEASLAYPAIPFLTLRIPTLAVWHFSVKYCLNAVRPEHAAFYKRVFHSTQFSGERYYHGLSFPMVLYACDIPEIYDGLLRRYPFFRSTEAERQALFESNPSSAAPLIRPSARQANHAHLKLV